MGLTFLDGWTAKDRGEKFIPALTDEAFFLKTGKENASGVPHVRRHPRGVRQEPLSRNFSGNFCARADPVGAVVGVTGRECTFFGPIGSGVGEPCGGGIFDVDIDSPT